MRFLPGLLLVLAGCAPASDGVILYREPLASLPDAWLCWRSEGNPALRGGTGMLIYADRRAEAVWRLTGWGDLGGTRRRQGTVSAADRAELEKTLAGPLAPAVRPKREPLGDLEPETEGSSRYVVEVRNADGTFRRLSYEHLSWPDGESGGEPLHPLILRILRDLPE